MDWIFSLASRHSHGKLFLSYKSPVDTSYPFSLAFDTRKFLDREYLQSRGQKNEAFTIANMANNMEKPSCGSSSKAGEYDVGLHTLGLFLVLTASIFGAGFPVVAKKVAWLRVPTKVFFACKHFGTGVLIATAFVHLLPTAWLSLSNPCLPDFFIVQYPPLPGIIMMASLFSLFMIEMWMNNKMGGHSHGGALGFEPNPTGTAVATVPPPSPQRSSPKASFETPISISVESETRSGESKVVMVSEKTIEDVEGQVDPLVYKKMNMNITLLEGGILFHSVFVGITVSITIDGFIVLLIAIIFHQVFEGLGLGSRIAAVPYPKGSIRPWLLVFAFGTTAPLGQAIGLATRNTYDPNSAFGLIIVGVFNAISSGLLIYAALVDLLAEDFLSEESSLTLTPKDKKIAFMWVILGAIGMSIIGAFA
ncbi:Fe transport protein 3 [Xylaria venustula]|nr:Fe transport protein 3 [Xylaria venustula]